jgi:uncharacterized membrane protein
MMFFVWPLLLLVAIAAFWYWGRERKGIPQPKDEDLLEMLKRRYARGEISKEEFEWGRKLLQDEP